MSTAKAYAVVMAGGRGTRFWPLSRSKHPKQLLHFGDAKQSLLQATVSRVQSLIPPERILVVTSAEVIEQVRAALPDVPAENVLGEPTGRNTAPCVGWAAVHALRRDPDALLAVLPADHYIVNGEAYRETLAKALHAAQEEALVTVGIRPTRAETGYGYIEVGEESSPGVHRARSFVEKPNRQRAGQFLSSGRFLWNSGMFFFKASVILEAIDRHLPGLGEQLRAYQAHTNLQDEQAAVQATYADLPSVSIDHGVMEKAERVSVVLSDFDWSDLGSWSSAWELAQHDDNGNAFPGETVAIDTIRTYVRAPEGKLVALIGVHDLIVVDTEDALLIVPRERAQEVREIVRELKERDDHRR